MELIGEKSLIMLVGPTAVGKTSVMNKAVKARQDFGYVESFTTRAPRIKENGHYRFISTSQASRLIASGQTITHVQHPTTGHIYGTTASSYHSAYSLLDTLSSSVEVYRGLPFKNTLTITLTAAPDQWRSWFVKRYPKNSPEALRRLAESAQSIRWSIADDETYWLVNKEDSLEATASKLVDIVTSPTTGSKAAPAEAYAMLELIEGGNLWPVK